ncbi:MAG: hypothetical protein ACE5JE_06545 [Thermoplasmata archaeon]
MTEAPGAATGFAPFSREEMDLASKDQLIGWCKEYGLDEGGMKYELRLRLLEYIRRQGLLLKGEEPLEEDGGSPAEAEATPPAPPPESANAGGETVQELVELPTDVAPATSPSVCANCGGELTFIPQYERWYCYSCDTYASSSGVATGDAVTASGHIASTSHAAARRSGRATAGIGLATAGLLTFIAHQVLFVAPALFPIPVFVTGTPEILFALPLVAFVLLGAGVIAGLRSLRPSG